jgi:hypothetical protein
MVAFAKSRRPIRIQHTGYDAADRLTSEVDYTDPEHYREVFACQYDAAGNRLWRRRYGSTSYYEYGPANELLSTTGDWRYVDNPNWTTEKEMPGYTGENIVYLGKGLWWGHGFGGGVRALSTLMGWRDMMRYRPWIPKNRKVGRFATVLEWMKYPHVGLKVGAK